MSTNGSGGETCQTPAGIIEHIQEGGFRAAKRDSRYRILERYY